jgi:hypothetical protein
MVNLLPKIPNLGTHEGFQMVNLIQKIPILVHMKGLPVVEFNTKNYKYLWFT